MSNTREKLIHPSEPIYITAQQVSENYTENGEITYDKLSREYTVWDETFTSTVCVTSYPKVAEAALVIYSEHYL